MAAHWYCLINGREHGPFTSEQIQRFVERGKLKRKHSVRPETDSHWTPASEIPGLFPASAGRDAPPVAKTVPPKVASMPSSGINAKPPKAGLPPVATATPVASLPQATDVDEHQKVPPVVTPVASPVAMPVAKPVATPVAKAVANPIATPVAKPVATPVAVPAVGAAPPPAASAIVASPPTSGGGSRGAGSHMPRGKHKSGNPYVIVGGLIGLMVVLAGVAVFVMTRSPRDKTTAASETTAQDPQLAAAQPAAGDPEADPYSEASEPPAAASAPQRPASLPTLGAWLDATRQKGGLRGIVKLGVSDVWLEPNESGGQTLNVDIQITNMSSEDSLEFRGWSGNAGGVIDTAAIMADETGTLLKPTSGSQPTSTAGKTRRIGSSGSHAERLTFAFPENTSASFRLALPYAAFGQTRYLGFEIPRLMIKDRPPGAEAEDEQTLDEAENVEAIPRMDEPDAADGMPRDGEERQRDKDVPERMGTEPAGDAPEGGHPATISDLRRSIEDSSQDAADGQDQ